MAPKLFLIRQHAGAMLWCMTTGSPPAAPPTPEQPPDGARFYRCGDCGKWHDALDIDDQCQGSAPPGWLVVAAAAVLWLSVLAGIVALLGVVNLLP